MLISLEKTAQIVPIATSISQILNMATLAAIQQIGTDAPKTGKSKKAA